MMNQEFKLNICFKTETQMVYWYVECEQKRKLGEREATKPHINYSRARELLYLALLKSSDF